MNLKKIILLSITLLFSTSLIFSQTNERIKTVVIDAGHGGSDPGAVGKNKKEKDITLAVALKLGRLISDNYSNVKIIYTRTTDVAVELFKRAKIANDNHADLFISIHCNSTTSSTPHGVETFVMGVEKSEASLAVARKENAAILKEKNYENNYEGFNPNSPEADIIFSLYTSAYLKNSAILASKVQKNLVHHTKFTDRGVKQAGFWVLYKVAMPSILVELGFISNLEEEHHLGKENGQEVMAKAIYNAFVEYKNVIEGTQKAGVPVPALSKDKPENKEEKPAPKELTDKKPDTGKGNTNDSTLVVRFRVQFYSCPTNLELSSSRFKGLENVKKYQHENSWKYTVGDETTFEDAQKLMTSMRQKGYSDAFIVSFKNEERISNKEARELIKK